MRTLEAGGKVSSMSYLSLLLSTLTTGFVSATLSYDYDTDPKKRGSNAEFYGYVPDGSKKRAVLFLTLIAISAVQVLLNSLLVVGLGNLNPTYALVYLLGDKVLFLSQKTAAGDFRH